MEKLANKIPIWAVNLITVVSGIITIITAFVGLGNLININDKQPYHWVYIIVIFALLFVVFIFFLQIRKYRQASSARLKVTSFNYHKLTHNCRDIYFDTMHNHKTKKENITTSVSYTHLRAHETDSYLVCRLLLEKKKKKKTH